MNGSVCGWCNEPNPDISTHVCNPEEHGWEQDDEYEGIKIMRRKEAL
jgi:hypothetical protein